MIKKKPGRPRVLPRRQVKKQNSVRVSDQVKSKLKKKFGGIQAYLDKKLEEDGIK